MQRRVESAPRGGRLFQEDLREEPFWMLVACQLVNLTTWTAAKPVFEGLRECYHDPEELSGASLQTLTDLLRPLGLYNRRARSLHALACWWTAEPPSVAADVLLLPGCGKYAHDSWAIFVDGRTDVDPADGKLNWYLRRHT